MEKIAIAQKAYRIKTLVDGLAFAECLRWHDGKLYFSDMHAHQVLAVDMNGNRELVCEVPGRPGGLGWLPDGRLLVVAMTERRIYRLDRDGFHMAADLSGLVPYFLNDMSVDGRGNAYVGDFGFDYYGGESFKPARLWLVRPDGSIACAAEEMLSPNGSVITPDNRTLIVAESSGMRLTAFDIEADGSLARRRIWADLPDGIPDGIGLDASNNVWVAVLGGNAVWQAQEGEGSIRKIALERDAYACAIGGSDRRTLFVATASSHDPETCKKRLDGRIEMMSLD